MVDQWWSWVLGFVGVVGFILAGKKVWWAWYVNLANQILWFAYSILSEQYGFLVVTVVYTIVFTKNAISWTKDHFKEAEEKPKQIPWLIPNFHRQAAGLPERPTGASMYGWCNYKQVQYPGMTAPVWWCTIHNTWSRHYVSKADSMLPCLEMDPYPTEELQEYADANRDRNSDGGESPVDQPEDREKRGLPPRGPDGRFRKRESN